MATETYTMATELTGNDVQTLEFWTVRELATRWRLSSDTVIRMCERGDVLARKYGGRWRVHVSAVEAFEQKGRPRKHAEARPSAVIDRGDPLGLYSSGKAGAR